jgi:hypothetical protein
MKHIPFDGSHPLFKIGLVPLDFVDWIEVDEHLDFYLDEKERLKTLYGDKVFAAEAGTEQTQQEALDLLAAHLKKHHQNTHSEETEVFKAGDHHIDLNAALPPLEIASQLVQEDLLLMRKGENGWRLVAASLCFPSSWSLLEKFSKPLDEIHKPVPGFGPGSRNAEMIFRIFDNLKTEQPVRRFNWSVYSDNELFHDDRAAEHLKKGALGVGAFMRVEHQTLRKLPVSGDILFTVRIHIDPLGMIAKQDNRADICAGFVASLEVLDAAQLAYKGLTQERDRLIAALRKIGEMEETA